MADFTVTTLNDELDSLDPAELAASPGDLSLREALVLAQNAAGADTIRFAPGLSGGTLTLTQGLLTLDSDVNILGDQNGDHVPDIAIDGDGTTRVFDVVTGTSSIDGLVIKGGYAFGSGGVLVIAGATLSISHSELYGNSGTYGGAINNEGTLAISDTEVHDNHANRGAGIFNRGSLSLTRVTIANNEADTGGGGILLQEGTLTVLDSTISGNEAGDGGGGLRTIGGSTATLTNVTVAGNRATGGYGGGGIYAAGDLKLTHVTVTGNHASDSGGGLHVGSGDTTITNSIIVGNGAGTTDDLSVHVAASSPTLAGVNLLGESTIPGRPGIDITGATAAQVFRDLLTVDPDDTWGNGDEFEGGVLADNGGPVETVALSSTGPAIDAGLATDAVYDDDGNPETPDVPIPTDARGHDRTSGAGADLGAFEFQAPQDLLVTTLADEAYDGGDYLAETADGHLSLREALGLANAGPDANTIRFAQSLDGGTLTLTNGILTLDGDVTILGDRNGDHTPDITIDGDGTTRVFDVVAGTSSIDGLIITGGYAFGSGGVLVIPGATLSISHAELHGNSGSYGGAINNEGNLAISDTEIHDNHAGRGAGIFNRSNLSLTRVTIADNESDGGGGGILLDQGTLTVLDSTISGNEAGDGGGGLRTIGGSTATLTNVTVAGNSAPGGYGGGGIYSAGDLKLTHVTVTGNSAAGSGGGLYVAANNAAITNSIIVGNGAPVVDDLFVHPAAVSPTLAGVNLFGETTIPGRPGIDITGVTATEVFRTVTTINPDGTPNNGDEFVAGVLADNGGPVETVALRGSGPAVDAGTTAAAVYDDDGNPATPDVPIPTDARGFDRTVGDAVDLGALEIQPLIVTTLEDETYEGGDLESELTDGVGLSLREALALANNPASGSGDGLIRFASNLAGGTLILTTGQQLVISSDGITIDGDIDHDGTADITISGDTDQSGTHSDGDTRIFWISDETGATIAATLNGLVIQDGRTTFQGAGIYVGNNDALTLTNAVVRNNAGSSDGGGIFLSNSTLKVFNSTIAGNTASNGGGVYAAGGSMTLVNSTIVGNSAGSDGGGLYGNSDVPIVLINSTVSGNHANDEGGGIYGWSGNPFTLINSTVTGNSAGGSGGGIYDDGSGVVRLTNSIIAGNRAGADGNDLFGGGSTLILNGKNILGSSPFDFDPTDTSNGSATEIDGTDQAALETVFRSVGIDPHTNVLSGVLADNGGLVETVLIKVGGIAHNPAGTVVPTDTADADRDGNTAETLPVDARGVGRVHGAGIDVGAVEIAEPVVANPIPDQTSPVNTPVSFQFAANAFTDQDSSLTFSATLLGGGALPTWLTFTPATRTFSGNPPQNFFGDLDITVTADDGDQTVSDTFRLTISNAGNDVLVSGPGPNSTGVGDIFALIGGTGDDVYGVADEVAEITEEVGGGTDTVYATVTYTMSPNVEGMVLQEVGGAIDGFGSDGNDTIFGNSLTNWLHGGEGSDALIGGGGNDVLFGDGGIDGMAGGSGDDTYVVDTTSDQIQESTGQGADTVYASASFTLPDNVEGLVLLEGAGPIDGTGSEGNDTIIGNSANNVLDGRGGSDALIGGGGNDLLIGGTGIDGMAGGLGDDTYGVDNTLDQIQENAGEGADTVYASATFTLFANLEALVLVDGAGAINGTGNGGDNYLFGNDSANTLYGLGGNDVIFGGAGADTLHGAGLNTVQGQGGDDVLTGGADNDDFVFGVAFGHDTITDFTAGDHIVFTNFLFGDFQTVQSRTFAIDATTSVIILNDANTLAVHHAPGYVFTQNDFLFTA